jgi:hypothetical protein
MDENQTPEALPVEHAQSVEQPVHQAEEGTHAKRTRSRRKKAEEAIEQATAEVNAEPEAKKAWQPLFPYWEDVEAGVKVEEDRQDKLITLYSRTKLPAQALEMLEERGWMKDNEVGGYTMEISELRPRQSRANAEQTARDVANIVRGELGMDEKQSFWLSRG